MRKANLLVYPFSIVHSKTSSPGLHRAKACGPRSVPTLGAHQCSKSPTRKIAVKIVRTLQAILAAALDTFRHAGAVLVTSRKSRLNDPEPQRFCATPRHQCQPPENPV